MTPDEIRAAVAASSELQALAAPGVRHDAAIAAALSIGRAPRVVSRMVSARSLASKVPGGPLAAEVILMKLEGARDAMLVSEDPGTRVMGSLLRRQLGFLASDGLDFGDAALRGMLDQFATLQILTADEVAGLKAIAETPDPINVNDVSAALNEGA